MAGSAIPFDIEVSYVKHMTSRAFVSTPRIEVRLKFFGDFEKKKQTGPSPQVKLMHDFRRLVPLAPRTNWEMSHTLKALSQRLRVLLRPRLIADAIPPSPARYRRDGQVRSGKDLRVELRFRTRAGAGL